MRRRLGFGSALCYGLLVVAAFYFIAPLYVMLVTSFKSNAEIREGTLLALPHVWNTEGWVQAWSGACSGLTCEGIQTYFQVTFTISVPAVILSVLIGALNGYVMAKWRSTATDILFAALMIGSFIPLQLFLIPLALTLRQLNLFGTTAGLILIHTIYGIPLTTMLFRNFYVNLPQELIKAAVLDGAGVLRQFFSVVLPLSPAILMVAVILVFTGIYNDFLFALTFGEQGRQPIMAAVQNIVNTSRGVKQYNVNMATVMLSALPTLLLFLVAGRFFVRGMMQGAIKG